MRSTTMKKLLLALAAIVFWYPDAFYRRGPVLPGCETLMQVAHILDEMLCILSRCLTINACGLLLAGA